MPWGFGPRTRDRHILYWSRGGRGSMTIEGREYPLEPGWLFWIAPDTFYGAKCAPGSRPDLSVVHVSFEGTSGPANQGRWHLAHQLSCASVFEHIMMMAQDAIEAELSGRQNFPPSRPLLVTLLGVAIHAMEPREAGGKERRIERVCRAIDADPTARTSIAELAELAGLSERYFAKVFQRHVGVTPKNYQLRSRMRYAYGLLAEQGLSVKECAVALGYSDTSVFSRQFAAAYQAPPSSLRR